MRYRMAGLAGVLSCLAIAGGLAGTAQAQGESRRQERQQRLVDRATLTAQDILNSGPNADQAQRFLARARGVLICPGIFRMSFLIGGSGGGCVLLGRDGAGSWSDPAFYTMGSGSIGFQAGVQDVELVMFIMTRRGLNAIMDNQFKFGADASVTLATLGTGVEGGTSSALNADLVALEQSSGLFAGISLQGSMLGFDGAGNQAYYGQPVGAQDIVMAMRVNNHGADPLRAVLMRFGGNPDATHPDIAPSPYPAPYQPHGVYDNGSGDNSSGPTQLAPNAPIQSQPLPPK